MGTCKVCGRPCKPTIAAHVMEAALEMSPIGDAHALRANESQARELVGLDPEQALDVMAKAHGANP